MDKEEKDASIEPLLDDGDTERSSSSTEDRATAIYQTQLKSLLRQQRYIRIGLLLAYIPAIFICIFGLVQWRRYSQSISPRLLPSPLYKDNAIEWNIQHFPPNYRSSVYAGEPSEELDLAWHKLFEYTDVRVSKDDLDKVGIKSVELVDGGYVAQPIVFHQLHCLKKIRHWIYKEHYILNQNITKQELEEWPYHIHHCIEMIRTALTCKSDIALSTYGWIGPENNRQPSLWDASPHQCVNWDKIMAWTKENSVDIKAPGSIYDENGKVFG